MREISSTNIIPTQSVFTKAEVIQEELLPAQSRKIDDKVDKKFGGMCF